jgi:hypothetical protein
LTQSLWFITQRDYGSLLKLFSSHSLVVNVLAVNALPLSGRIYILSHPGQVSSNLYYNFT